MESVVFYFHEQVNFMAVSAQNSCLQIESSFQVVNYCWLIKTIYRQITL